jgi:hypothetical protein
VDRGDPDCDRLRLVHRRAGNRTDSGATVLIWLRKNRGLISVVALVVIPAIAIFWVGSIASDAQDSADQAKDSAVEAKALAVQNRALIASNRAVIKIVQDSQVLGCKRENILRSALVANFKDQIRETRATDHNLFPNIPVKRFRALIGKSVKRLRTSVGRVEPKPCQ